MRREIIITEDGSSSIYLPEWKENYHSKHGAIQEAYHVFMQMGFFCFLERNASIRKVNILEVGFGTGLNAFIAFSEAEKNNIDVFYDAIEAFPISSAEMKKLNYPSLIAEGTLTSFFQKMHEIPWEETYPINENFRLTKKNRLIQEIEEQEKFDLLFFDAFAPQFQPELWTEEIFQKMFRAMKTNGVLVTYCAKGNVRRAMQAVGFQVERIQGPPGKREMLRATKLF